MAEIRLDLTDEEAERLFRIAEAAGEDDIAEQISFQTAMNKLSMPVRDMTVNATVDLELLNEFLKRVASGEVTEVELARLANS